MVKDSSVYKEIPSQEKLGKLGKAKIPDQYVVPSIKTGSKKAISITSATNFYLQHEHGLQKKLRKFGETKLRHLLFQSISAGAFQDTSTHLKGTFLDEKFLRQLGKNRISSRGDKKDAAAYPRSKETEELSRTLEKNRISGSSRRDKKDAATFPGSAVNEELTIKLGKNRISGLSRGDEKDVAAYPRSKETEELSRTLEKNRISGFSRGDKKDAATFPGSAVNEKLTIKLGKNRISSRGDKKDAAAYPRSIETEELSRKLEKNRISGSSRGDEKDAATFPGSAVNEDLKLSEGSATGSLLSNGSISGKIAQLATYSETPLEVPSDLPDVQQELQKLCKEGNVMDAVITYHPSDYKRMVLNGDGVTRLLTDLERLQEKYAGYEFKVNEFKGFDYFEPLGNPPKQTLLRNGLNAKGTIGLVVTGKDLKSGTIKQYAVTAAHCVLDNETTKSARTGDPLSIREAQRKLTEEMRAAQWSIKSCHHAPIHPVDGFPEYRLYSFAGRGNWHDEFSFDIALLEFNDSAFLFRENTNLNGIFEISQKEHLLQMIKRKVQVFVGESDIPGRILPSPEPVNVINGNGLISGLVVYITTDVELCHGQSGSVIKVKYNNYNRYEAIGILHAKLNLVSFEQTQLYSGVLLYPNLHQIEADYPIKHFEIAKIAHSNPNISNEQRINNLSAFSFQNRLHHM